MKRIIIILLLILNRNGYARAKFLKKKKYFHSQGENCFFSTHLFGTEPKHISFGDNVWLATRVSFITHDVSVLMIQNYLNDDSLMFDYVGYVKIGNNVFIGADSIILPNVVIADNVVIGAGSIVSKSIKESGVYVGNPLRKVKTFSDYCSDLVEKHTNYPWSFELRDRRKNKKVLNKLREQYVRTELDD
ncbi:acyltransferase [Tenacibaculum sp. MEBiC06402]|uniref:acyltransferase n=1 Tax=unclassified Tenacibaculum TaxID=2635139 RepID=UPI003B9B259C